MVPLKIFSEEDTRNCLPTKIYGEEWTHILFSILEIIPVISHCGILLEYYTVSILQKLTLSINLFFRWSDILCLGDREREIIFPLLSGEFFL